MRILEFGDNNNPSLMFISGFMSNLSGTLDIIEYFKNDYYCIVPVLPCHDPKLNEDFFSFSDIAITIEDFINTRNIAIDYCYSSSMGGVLASLLLTRGKIKLNNLILESSPLLPFNNLLITTLKKNYLTICAKTRSRDPKVLAKATKSITTKEHLADFLSLVDNFSEDNIIRYLDETFKYEMKVIKTNTKITYIYGGHLSELPFKKVSKFLVKNYPLTKVIKYKGKKHCEDMILNKNLGIKNLEKLLK